MARSAALTAIFGIISVIGFASTAGLLEKRGWTDMRDTFLVQRPTLIPGTDDVPARTHFTGLGPIDYMLTQLLHFFYHCVSGQLPQLSIFTVYFLGQVLAVHSCVMLESFREGNIGTLLAFPGVWGTIYQSIPFGIVMPIYCAVYVWKSPLANLSQPSATASLQTKAQLLAMNPVQLRAVRGAMILGFIGPSILPSLRGVITPDQQQVFIGVWQFFPLLVSIWQALLAGVARVLRLTPESAQKSPEAKLEYGRRIYVYLLLITAAVHLGAISFVAFPNVRPAFFGLTGKEGIDIRSTFVPTPFWAPSPIANLAEGCLTLLQYDFYCGALATLIWVTFVSGTSTKEATPMGRAETLATALVRSIFVGPAGAGLWALWDRDEAILRAVKEKQKSG